VPKGIKKIVPVMISPQDTSMRVAPVKFQRQSAVPRTADQDQFKKAETSTKTYSFCEKKTKTKANSKGVAILVPNPTRTGKTLTSQLSEKLSSLYGAAPGVGPIQQQASAESNKNLMSSQELPGDQIQNQQTMQILESMENIIQNSKKSIPFKNVIDKLQNPASTTLAQENCQISQNSAFMVFDRNKSNKRSEKDS
jgi:hypothetical protein